MPTTSVLPRNRLAARLGLLCVLALAGCTGDDLVRNFGFTRDAPDEFTVTTRAPLSMPPDFSLRPPAPGAPRPQEPVLTAETTLVPQSALNPPAAGGDSAGQDALLAAAGKPAPPGIRAQIDAEAAKSESNTSFTDRLMFWKTPTPPGTPVDPQKEAERLRQNAALGQPPDVGETPTIQRKSHNFIDTLF